jgi:hypothetical protein
VTGRSPSDSSAAATTALAVKPGTETLQTGCPVLQAAGVIKAYRRAFLATALCGPLPAHTEAADSFMTFTTVVD